jgi:hypothetical protein
VQSGKSKPFRKDSPFGQLYSRAEARHPRPFICNTTSVFVSPRPGSFQNTATGRCSQHKSLFSGINPYLIEFRGNRRHLDSQASMQWRVRSAAPGVRSSLLRSRIVLPLDLLISGSPHEAVVHRHAGFRLVLLRPCIRSGRHGHVYAFAQCHLAAWKRPRHAGRRHRNPNGRSRTLIARRQFAA